MHSFTALIAACLSSGLVSAACTSPNVNTASLNLIKGYEKYSATVYSDQGGKPTIGYGHLCSSSSCSEIGYPIPLSEANAESLLQSDLKVARDCITLKTNSAVVLNANEYGAFVSWAFNVGCGTSGAGGSTLLKRLNNGENPITVAEQELPKWNKVNGAVSQGLVNRRNAEINLAETATSVGALPACS